MQKYIKLKEIEVSRYHSAKDSRKQAGVYSLFYFLRDIQQGQYSRAVMAVREEPDPKRQSTLKNSTLTAITPSGQWPQNRGMAEAHRQYAIICVDIDDKEQGRPMREIGAFIAEQAASTSPQASPFLFAYHKSTRGNGFAVYYTYEPPQGGGVTDAGHRQAFAELRALYEAQGIKIDSTPDPTRLRFCSYDTEGFIHADAAQVNVAYADHPEQQEQAPKPTEQGPSPRSFAPSTGGTGTAASTAEGTTRPADAQTFEHYQTRQDVAFIAAHCEAHSFDLPLQYSQRVSTSHYDAWVKMGQALTGLGPEGEEYFNMLSRINAAHYNAAEAAKKWQELAKNTRSVKIASFFQMAKVCGLPLRDPYQAQAAAYAATAFAKVGKAGGLKSKEAAIEEVASFTKHTGGTIQQQNEAQEIAQRIAERPDLWNEEKDKPTLQDVQAFFAKQNLRYNVVSQRYEYKGKILDDRLFSTLLMRAKEKVGGRMGKEISRELAQTIIADKEQTPEYNPFENYLESIRGNSGGGGHVDALLNCIQFTDPDKAEFCKGLIRRWLIGVVASMQGTHSVLCLVLTGGQGIGKTLFFRELLPEELRPYYSQDKLKEGKDSMLLLSRKLIICDDEWGGKSKKDVEAMKEILSMETITARRPYGIFDEDYKRRAVLCGTTNRTDLLSDDSGNRRILPVGIASLNVEEMRKVNRAHLFAELLEAYEAAPQGWYLAADDVEELKSMTEGQYDAPSREGDILRLMLHTAEVTKQDLLIEEIDASFSGAIVDVSTSFLCRQIEIIAGGKFTANPTKVGAWLKGNGYTKRKARASSMRFMTAKGSRAWAVSFSKEYSDYYSSPPETIAQPKNEYRPF